MKRFLQSEIGAAVVWVIGSLLMAAWVTPWIYQAGKWLADSASHGDFPGIVEWFAKACGRARLDRYFVRCLMFFALALFPWVAWRIRALRAAGLAPPVTGMTRYGMKSALIQVIAGCLVATLVFCCLGWVLQAAGAFVPRPHHPGPGKLLEKIVLPALGAALVEEWVFRGVLLGLWLRFSRPLGACVGSSLLFAFLHFLKPPAGVVTGDPGAAFAGFELLAKILLHYTDPLFFVADFATLAGVGLILAWGRVRSGALWFSIGLHSGWVMVFKAHNLIYQDAPGHVLRPWAVGDTLRSGVLPMLALAVTAWICWWLLPRITCGPPSVSRASR